MKNQISNTKSASCFSALINTMKVSVGNSIKNIFLSLFGFALVLLLQISFFSSEAIASPLAGLFGNKVSETTQSVKTDRAIDKVTNSTKENIGKAKEVAKDVKDKIGDGVDKAKAMASDRTNAMKNGVKDLPEKAGNKVDEAIDSVKGFLGK